MEDQDKQEFIVAQCYRLSNEKIASGGFSQIRIAEHITSGTKVAAKLETIDNKNRLPQLYIEYKIYKKLGTKVGFATIYYFNKFNGYYILIMKLLGKNLEQVFELCHRQFSLKTILYLALQLLERFEYIHYNGIVYRDVKPENFLLGLGKDQNIIHVIDFGLSKSFIDANSMNHIEMSINKRKMIGTVRYMSLNAHQGIEQSRRDDLESIGYLFIYLLRQGKLPWSDLHVDVDVDVIDSIKYFYDKIFEIKYSIPIETLCHGFPIEFANYLRYVRSLDFKQKPDYYYLKKLFNDLFEREHFLQDGCFDWTNRLM